MPSFPFPKSGSDSASQGGRGVPKSIGRMNALLDVCAPASWQAILPADPLDDDFEMWRQIALDGIAAQDSPNAAAPDNGWLCQETGGWRCIPNRLREHAIAYTESETARRQQLMLHRLRALAAVCKDQDGSELSFPFVSSMKILLLLARYLGPF